MHLSPLINAAILKLGVATLLRVAKFQKRDFEIREFLDQFDQKARKNALLCGILICREWQEFLKGREISKNKYGDRKQKSLRTPELSNCVDRACAEVNK